MTSVPPTSWALRGMTFFVALSRRRLSAWHAATNLANGSNRLAVSVCTRLLAWLRIAYASLSAAMDPLVLPPNTSLERTRER